MDGTCLISRTLDPDTVQLQESERVSTPSFPKRFAEPCAPAGMARIWVGGGGHMAFI
jgi:hypothetical protein